MNNPKKYGYKVNVTFERVFTKGTFKGMTMKDRLPFCSKESANDWVAGCQKYAERNGYYLANVEITSI